MTGESMPGIQSRGAAIFGWLMFIGFFVLLWNILQLPRTALELRGGLRIFHDSLGLIVMCLAIVRLIWMAKAPAPRPPAGLPENSFAFNRTLLAAIYLAFAATGLIGFLFAFGEWDRPVILFGVQIPNLIDESDAVRKPFGYLHSALGFYYMMLATIWLAYGVFQHLRYRVGLARLLPGTRI